MTLLMLANNIPAFSFSLDVSRVLSSWSTSVYELSARPLIKWICRQGMPAAYSLWFSLFDSSYSYAYIKTNSFNFIFIFIYDNAPFLYYLCEISLPKNVCVSQLLLWKESLLESLGFSGLSWAICVLAWKKSLQVLDYLDGEEKTCNFSFFAHWIPIVELPLEIILPWKRKFTSTWFSLLIAVTCRVHLLNENGEVEPALASLNMSNWNTTNQQNTNVLILGFWSNKKHLCRRTTASAKIQVRATLSFHPNLFLSSLYLSWW